MLKCGDILNLFSYVVRRDYGFAPNPFPPFCTLATCKPIIRNIANINDWVIGTGSTAEKSPFKNKLIYAMKVTQKMTYDDYWNNPDFQYKKAVMNGSLRQQYGDNIYHHDAAHQQYIQENSHHSLAGGIVNKLNYNRDLTSQYVLVSDYYWYFGKSAVLLPFEFEKLIKRGPGFKKIDEKNCSAIIREFILWIEQFSDRKFIDCPALFNRPFERYDGR